MAQKQFKVLETPTISLREKVVERKRERGKPELNCLRIIEFIVLLTEVKLTIIQEEFDYA